MAEEKTITLNELNSKIKEQTQAKNQPAQKALLIIKGGLKAYPGDAYTKQQVEELVKVRIEGENAAAETAASLNNDELFEYCESLAGGLNQVLDICFPEASSEETTEEEKTTEESEEESTEESEEEETSEETEEEESSEEETQEEGEEKSE